MSTDAALLASRLRGRKILAVTGAGLSTDSGLPDYRGKGSLGKPSVEFDQFVSADYWQRWVWERNQATWGALQNLQPTPAHRALAKLQEMGLLIGEATQNVDALSRKAGISPLYEMHGAYDRVVCLDCGEVTGRGRLDERLRELNPNLAYSNDPKDVAILAVADEAKARASKFITAPCERCGGLLKPDIVFFGEMLPEKAIMGALELASQCDVVLVLGTSLLVGTGTIPIRGALAHGAELVIINRGPTTADNAADLRIEGGVSETLTAALELL